MRVFEHRPGMQASSHFTSDVLKKIAKLAVSPLM